MYECILICESMYILEVHAIIHYTPAAFTCSKLTIGTLEQGVKYVQS